MTLSTRFNFQDWTKPQYDQLRDMSLQLEKLNQLIIGRYFWPRTAAEIAAGVTPVNYYYEPGDVRRYGASPTASASVNTAAFVAASASLSDNSIFKVTGGNYHVSPTKGIYETIAANFAISNLDGVSIICDGATIIDDNVYAGTDAALLFSLTNCSNIKVRLNITTQAWTVNKVGLNVVQFLQGCTGIDVDVEITGGIAAVWAYRIAADPVSYTSRLFKIRVHATNNEYPLLLEKSGDEVKAQIYSTACGRTFFIHGVKNVDLQVHSLNPVATSIIAAYGGSGCDGVNVDYYDRDSTAATASAPLVAIQYSDQTAATIRNVALKFNVQANAGAAEWHDNVRVVKLDNAGAVDNVGRGHVLDGLDISGVMGHQSRKNITNVGFGDFVTTGTADVQRNINFHDLTVTGVSGGGNIDFNLGALSGVARAANIIGTVPGSTVSVLMRNVGNGRVLYEAVNAVAFTDGAANADVHTYIASTQTTPQTLQINKTYLNSTEGARQLDNVNGQSVIISSLANDAVTQLTPTNDADSISFVFMLGDGGASAQFLLQGANHATFLVSDPTANFSITAATANKTNVYWSAGNSRYELENKRGSAQSYQVVLISRIF